MENLYDFLDGGIGFNTITFLLAILGLLLSLYFYKKSIKTKIPLFAIRSINIISDDIKNISDILINYKGNEINNLTVTKIAFWNGGNETLYGVDQTELDKLRINLNILYNHSYKILDIKVIFQSHYTNNIKIMNIKYFPNDLYVLSDYLNKNQGCVIKVTHTGKKSSDINLLGTFKGSKPLQQYNADPFDRSTAFNKNPSTNIRKISYHSFLKSKYIMRIFSIVSIFIFLLLTLYDIYLLNSWLNITLSIICLVLFSVLLYFNPTTFLKKGSLPKGFEIFYNDE